MARCSEEGRPRKHLQILEEIKIFQNCEPGSCTNRQPLVQPFLRVPHTPFPYVYKTTSHSQGQVHWNDSFILNEVAEGNCSKEGTWTGGVALWQVAGQREGQAPVNGLGQVGSLPDSPGSGCGGGRAVPLETLFRTSLD